MKTGKIQTQSTEVSVGKRPVASCTPSHQGRDRYRKQLVFQKINFTLNSEAESRQQSAAQGLNRSQPPAKDLDPVGLEPSFKHPGTHNSSCGILETATESREGLLNMQMWKPRLHFHVGLSALTGNWSYWWQFHWWNKFRNRAPSEQL